jgi:predicted RNase H-like nuclease (RuvC/YqgF family)
MPTFDSRAAEIMTYVILSAGGLLLLAAGFFVGRALGLMRGSRDVQAVRNDVFTTQQGFKKLYETEIASLKQQNEALSAEAKTLSARVEEYRKKAAGFGGLFSSGNKKSDAMYALLLENEALEDALHKQNQRLTTERADAVQESLRNIGYRRVLMSQLLNDNRIKDYVREILEDEHRLPRVEGRVENGQPKLPAADSQ